MLTPDYKKWLTDIKQYIRQSQIKAAIKVNNELIKVYWRLGKDIAERYVPVYGSDFYNTLSRDLMHEFPSMKGFSVTNLKFCRRFFEFYHQSDIIRQQVVDEFSSPIFHIPWGHHIQLLTKCKSVDEALFYVRKTVENGWSRAVLLNHIDAELHLTQGKAISNFSCMLPSPMSDLAQQSLKDPYCFDFLCLQESYSERQLQDALTTQLTRFLLELGNGFAFVGQQYRLQVGTQEFFADLLFYHLKLRCYIVIELKVDKFKPEHLGQLGFYVSTIDRDVKLPSDNPTIGLLICKTKDNIVAEYSLGATNQPIGISEYQIRHDLPESLAKNLPSIQEIEANLTNA